MSKLSTMNIDLYRKRRLRSTQPILTRVQIRDLGRKIGFTSFRQSVEFFMDPYNYFKLSKVKMADIHQYLLEKGITTEKCPNTHIRQGDHSRVLISILFPGYPIIKSSEHHYRDLRENRSPQAKLIDLAYDQLPTTDKFERLDELFRSDVNWAKEDGSYSIDIALKKLNRSIVVEGHASSKINVRLFLYLWTSERMAWAPSDFKLLVDNDDKDCLTESDKHTHEDGFKHTDITEKSDAIVKANRRSTGSVKFTFAFNRRPNVHHVSVCAVIEKSSEELTSQLYMQTSSLYIGRAMERASKNTILADQVQQKAIGLLNSYSQNDRLILDKTEELFLSCADAFITEWNDIEEPQDDDTMEVYAGNEVISVLDPITLVVVQHPARCIFCTHNTCFDAKVFFEFQVKSMQWKCPICSVKVRGIQDLYIDYHTKSALKKYPGQEKFLREANDVYSVIPSLDTPAEKRPIEYDLILIDDDDHDTKRVKTNP